MKGLLGLSKQHICTSSADDLDHAIWMQLPVPIFWKNCEGTYLGCNQQFAIQLGLKSNHDIIGKNDFELCWSRQAHLLRQHDAAVKNNRQYHEWQERLSFGRGECACLYVVAPLLDVAGEIIGLLGAVFDLANIYQELNKNKELIKQISLKYRLQSDLIHKTNHLLGPALHRGQTLCWSLLNTAGLELPWAMIKELLTTLELFSVTWDTVSALAENSLLAPSQATRLFRLRESVQKVRELLEPSVRIQGLQWVVEIEENIPQYLWGNDFALQQVLINLMRCVLGLGWQGVIRLQLTAISPLLFGDLNESDALCYPRPTLTAEKALDNQLNKGAACVAIGVTVSNGIFPNQQNQLWWQKAFGLQKSGENGSSIDCVHWCNASCWVAQLNGHVGIHQSEPGLAQQISGCLPFSAAKVEDWFVFQAECMKTMDEKSHIDVAAACDERKIRILLVEDNEVVRKVTMGLLSVLNTLVDCALDGVEAVALFKSKPYDMVFLDIRLPDIDGYEVAKQLRAWENMQNYSKMPVPIVALTAHMERQGGQRCQSVGINEILVKPATRDQLRDCIVRYAAQKNPAVVNPKTTKVSKGYRIEVFGDEEIAKEFFENFLQELEKVSAQIVNLYQDQNLRELREVIHKLAGAVSYCDLPDFRSQLLAWENRLTGSLDPDLIRQSYEIVMREIAQIFARFG